MTALLATESEYCWRERRRTRWRRSGSQNGSRPAATFWRCVSCGGERIAMENVSCVETLAVTILNERRRGAVADEATATLDLDDALGDVIAGIVAARTIWDPARSPSFLSFATWKGRNALSDWYRTQLGRDTPKAHAWSVPLDLTVSDDDETVSGATTIAAPSAEAVASFEDAVVMISDPEIEEALRTIVVPLASGYSQAEVAEMLGRTEGWVGARLRWLRSRTDLRDLATA